MTSTKKEDLQTLGGRLRFARERRNMGSRELAREAGLKSESHVSLIESGRVFNDLKGLRKLADRLRVSMDWLVSGGDVPDDLREAPAEPSATFPDPNPATGTDGVR